MNTPPTTEATSSATVPGKPSTPGRSADENNAREAVFAIIGSDLGAPAAYTGDWHEALRTTAGRWSTEPTA